MMSDAMRFRQKLYKEYLDHYKELTKKDERYKKTVQLITKNKERFMSGIPLEQIIKGEIRC